MENLRLFSAPTDDDLIIECLKKAPDCMSFFSASFDFSSRNEITLIINICDTSFILLVLQHFHPIPPLFSRLELHSFVLNSTPSSSSSSSALLFLFVTSTDVCDCGIAWKYHKTLWVFRSPFGSLFSVNEREHFAYTGTEKSEREREKTSVEWKVRRRIWKIHIIIRYSHCREGGGTAERWGHLLCKEKQLARERERLEGKGKRPKMKKKKILSVRVRKSLSRLF